MSLITTQSILSQEIVPNCSVVQVIAPSAILSEEVVGLGAINRQLIIANASSLLSTENFGRPELIRRPRFVESVAKIVRHQVPDYVKSDFPRFLDFLEKYYEWMEINGNALHLSKNLKNYQDVDTTSLDFLHGLQKETMAKLPKELYVDPSDPNNRVSIQNTIKNIIQFYGAKGTERAYQYLFRLVLGTEVGFYYPRTDMLRPSDGKWIQNYTIRITVPTNSTGTGFDFLNQKIFGLSSLATALVEYVIKFEIGFNTVYELFLNRSSITGDFFPGEEVISNGAPGVIGNPIACLTSFKLYDRGSDYSEGSIITSNFGIFGVQEFTGIVSTINNTGNVLKVDVIDPGFNIPLNAFSVVNPLDRTYLGLINYETNGDDELHIIPQIGTIIKYKGFFANDDGKLSDAKYIQDSYYYQQFSYVLKVNESLNVYKSLVEDLLHPAGLKLFGNFVSENFVESIPQIAENVIELIINSYSVYDQPTDQQTETILKITLDGNIEPELDEYQLESLVSYKPGASLYSIDKFKFTYKQNDTGFDEYRMNHQNNYNYWNNDFANYQIKDLFDITVGDFWLKPWKKTKIQPEPVLRVATSPDVNVDYDIPAAIPVFPAPFNQTLVIQVGISSNESFGNYIVAGPITSNSINGGEIFGTPSIKIYLLNTGILTEEVFGNLQVNLNINLPGITSLEFVNTPTIINS